MEEFLRKGYRKCLSTAESSLRHLNGKVALENYNDNLASIRLIPQSNRESLKFGSVNTASIADNFFVF
jgi:hypothetical protein